MKLSWDDGERIFWRGQFDAPSRQNVLFARPAIEQPLPETLDRLAREFDLRNELDSAWAARPLLLTRENNQTTLVLEDPGGGPLAHLLDGPLEISLFLELALGIATALDKLHQHGLIHKDIKPAHILVHCTDGRARFTGFGLASRLPRERQAPTPPETIAGTLAYMAPEQTGRMNRSVDSRSDLYALGVTFYQMLTGMLPFSAMDAMEWVHCHIARTPMPAAERVATVPAAISRIVMKLLAKTAEDRYQTAAGLEHDLRRCLADWNRLGRIDEFSLDELGAPDRLIIPEKLYGREREVDALAAAFARIVGSGVPELVLVAGYSGIGKSSVVDELHKILVPRRGLFASGKFDQHKRNVPYATLIQAFQSLVRALLGKPDAELESWREMLQEALSPNAALMTDLIPDLKLIIGEPPPVAELEPHQAQLRFQLVFRRFIGAFARPEHPLALFLDDLQWLDSATLDLLGDLLTHPDLRHLMLIGAYRDNEVDAAHPLAASLQTMRSAGVRVDEIRLAPLSDAHIQHLIADALRHTPGSVQPLARLVRDKTGGNPFFVIQFLLALSEAGLLVFDHAARQWQWDTERIHATAYTDNIVDLLAGKLERLPPATQQALQQLACLGSAAGAATLSAVLGMPQAELHALLWEAIRQELIVRRENAYAFIHDRVHEAAYSLIAPQSRAEAHLRIGRLLVARTPPAQREETIFDIVGQMNRGAALIAEPQEREQLAELNLLAGQRAKASTAYASALAYFTAGGELLDEECWQRRHALSFALALNRAECELLTGQLPLAKERLAALTERAATTVEHARVACLQTDIYLMLGQSEEAVTVSLAFLRRTGVAWQPRPDEATVRREYERIWSLVGDRRIESLIDMPPMEDPVALATVEVLTRFLPSAVLTDTNLGCLTICKAINLSLEHGNGDASCVAYTNFPKFAGRFFGNYQAGFQFGKLGCELVERRGLERYKASTYHAYTIFVAHWAQPVRACSSQVRRVFDMASRTGDIPFSAFACNCLISNLLFTGEPLPGLQREAEARLAYARKVGFSVVVHFIQNQLALIRMLRGLTPVLGQLEDGHYHEARTEHQLSNPSLAIAACWYWVRKLQARYLAGDHEAAMHAASRAHELRWTLHAFIEEAEYYFYAALARAGWCGSIPAGDRPPHLAMLAAHHRELRTWAELCPENFASHVALVGAEIARLEDRLVDAEMLYEQAIHSAQDSGFPHIEALANELASHFYDARGLGKIARAYMHDARYGYLRWGANGKVRQLEATHAYLKTEETAPRPTNTIAAPIEHLDLATVIKVTQAASGEIHLEKLIDMVMRTAIEQAGAERGLLILSQGGAGYRVAAQATTRGDAVLLQLSDTPLSAAMLPESVLLHVLRTHETISVDDASADPAWAADPYVRQHRARSVLCLPLVNGALLMGALYLENNLTARVFSAGRVAMLRLVASQAAISIENARLYREVADSEARFRSLVEANIIGIVTWHADGTIVEANDVFLRMVGYSREDLESRLIRWDELTPEEFRVATEQAQQQCRQTGRAHPFEKAYIRKDGSRVSVIVGLALSGTGQGIGFVLDLSEQKQAEMKFRESEQRYREVQTELAHATRVATMGQLTASIAHEVNQPIAATVTNAEAALRWLDLQPADTREARLALGRIVKDANRAGEVLNRIRQLIRKAPPRKEPVDINEAIREIIELTRGEAKKGHAAIQTQLADGLPLVEGDRVELQQVLLNLIINALEAMAGVHDGLRQVHVSTRKADRGLVLVAVRDSGPGFGLDDKERPFTAFYTTKSTGLGMGLSICRSIIDAHGGRLWASENSPRGAVVQFTVPAHPAVGA